MIIFLFILESSFRIGNIELKTKKSRESSSRVQPIPWIEQGIDRFDM